MAWYYGTFSCGHEGRVNIIGPTKFRQFKADRKFSGLCPECYEKHIQEERKKATKVAEEKAKELELQKDKKFVGNWIRKKTINGKKYNKEITAYNLENLKEVELNG